MVNKSTQINISEAIQFSAKQKDVFSSIGKSSYIVAGGARGGGKTYFIVAAAVLCAILYPGLRIMIIRKSLDELRQQIIENELLKRYYPGKLFKWRDGKKTAYFPNGSVIYFRSIEDERRDVRKVQGVEFGMLLLDEGNQLSEEAIRKLLGSMRDFGDSGFKPTMIMTCNPGGECDDYVMRYWENPDYSKWTQEELAIKSEYRFIPFTIYDNPNADPSYIRYLETLPDDLKQQWLYGKWGIASGAFFTEFDRRVHVIEPFHIPEDWTRFMSVDLGYGLHPSVCLLAAQDPKTGCVYVYDEISTTDTTEIFIDMILNSMGDLEYVPAFFDPNSLKSRRGETSGALSPAQMFQMAGINVQPANNERVNGWINVKTYMTNTPERPTRLKIFGHCSGLIETIPIQRYHGGKLDLNTRGKDDYVDALRYLLSHMPYGSMIASDGTIETPDKKELGFERERYPISQGSPSPITDTLVDFEGELVSRYCIF